MDTMSDSAKTVLITGSSRGIGLTLAEKYHAAGWNVIAAVRNPSKATEWWGVNRGGLTITFLDVLPQLHAMLPSKIVQLDVADEDSIAETARQLDGEPIDLLINNAGILEEHALDTLTKASVMKQFEINAVGPLLVTRAFVPHLKAAVALRGSALVINMTSKAGSITYNTGSRYGYRASKAGLNMINSSLALDLKPEGIIAVAMHPGFVATEMNQYTGRLEKDVSVAGMVGVIARLSMDDTGSYIDYEGVTLPW